MIINFNKSLYSLKAIKSTTSAYKKLAKFKITENEKYFALELTDIKKGVKNIIRGEFSNYVLSEVKE